VNDRDQLKNDILKFKKDEEEKIQPPDFGNHDNESLPSNTSEGSHLERNNIVRNDNSILGHCDPSREMVPKSFMSTNNPILEKGFSRTLEECKHEEGYQPLLFQPVISEPKQ
jgi:hypothetical protein